MIADLLIIGWVGSGIYAHIRQCNEMVTYFGKPIWGDPFTYVMFFPAIIGGPICLLMFEEYPDRHPERNQSPN